MERIVLGGGCFWCTEAVFARLRGVDAVRSGYAGTDTDKATYDMVSSGRTNLVESIAVQFDPAVISLEVLLEVFFASHDPTTRNQQGADIGTQYASVIYCVDQEQLHRVMVYVEQNIAPRFARPLVTRIEMLEGFVPAEEYHQKFYDKNPDYPYCQLIIDPKIRKILKEFAPLVTS